MDGPTPSPAPHSGSKDWASEASDFKDGFLTILPLLGAIAPFSVVFGALAAQAGVSVSEATLMSALMYAGASQLVAVDLWSERVPVWLVIVSVIAVNFRHVLYSAALAPIVRRARFWEKVTVFGLMVDPQFALTQARADAGKPFSFAWYLGVALPTYVIWVVLTAVGAAGGRFINEPERLALDMLLPIYFLGLVMGFRRRPRWSFVVLVSAVTALIVSNAPAFGVSWLGPPWHITLGGIAGVLVAALLPPRNQDRFLSSASEEANAPGGGTGGH
ncbi:MAG: AzlC family ABC transporter permease [Pseudomonadota bacterium]